MKKLRSNLRKEEIALVKRYQHWYRVIDNKLRVFIDLSCKNNIGDKVNELHWSENRACLCTDNSKYCKNFYDDHKDLDMEFFLKADSMALYSEYEVKEWLLKDDVIQVVFE